MRENKNIKKSIQEAITFMTLLKVHGATDYWTKEEMNYYYKTLNNLKNSLKQLNKKI